MNCPKCKIKMKSWCKFEVLDTGNDMNGYTCPKCIGTYLDLDISDIDGFVFDGKIVNKSNFKLVLLVNSWDKG